MDNMIVKQATNSLGEVDFSVGAVSNGYRYFNDSYIDSLAQQFAGIPHVEASSALLRDTVAIQDNASGLSNPSFTLLGLNDSLVQNFGHFYDLEGNEIQVAPSINEIYLNERAAKDIDAHQGDVILLFEGQNQVVAVTLSKIVQNKGLGGVQRDQPGDQSGHNEHFCRPIPHPAYRAKQFHLHLIGWSRRQRIAIWRPSRQRYRFYPESFDISHRLEDPE
jgi:hypothetical protein